MPQVEKPVDVIDLCSDDDSLTGASTAHVLNRSRTSSSDGTNEKVSKKRKITSFERDVVVILLQDENIETTDVSGLLYQIAPSGKAVTLFSHMNDGATSPTLYHIQQRDQWSCGFRNLQMILTNLLAAAPDNHGFFSDRPKQDGQVVEIPTLLQIQHLLEQAWESGWDENGAKHYQRKLAHTKAWIGAVEVASALGFLNVDCTFVQFIECSQSRSLLGPFCKAYFQKRTGCCACLGRSSRDYAMETMQWAEQRLHQPTGAPSCTCPVLPLYLQWEGHSVTIVGVEMNKDMAVSQLLVLDPMKCGKRIAKELRQGNIAPLRKPLASLLSRNSQIIVCSTNSMTHGQRESIKRTANCLTAAEKEVEKALLLKRFGR